MTDTSIDPEPAGCQAPGKNLLWCQWNNEIKSLPSSCSYCYFFFGTFLLNLKGVPCLYFSHRCFTSVAASSPFMPSECVAFSGPSLSPNPTSFKHLRQILLKLFLDTSSHGELTTMPETFVSLDTQLLGNFSMCFFQYHQVILHFSGDTNWRSYDLTQFWENLPGGSISSHVLKA